MNLHRRLGRLLAVTLGALTLLTGTATVPAQADHILSSHWSYFKWPGYTPTGVRAFYVFDRSGDATVGAAIRQSLADLEFDLRARNAWGIVPAPSYINDV